VLVADCWKAAIYSVKNAGREKLTDYPIVGYQNNMDDLRTDQFKELAEYKTVIDWPYSTVPLRGAVVESQDQGN
jgi:hypothetical protein